METLKTAVIVVLLLAVLYGVYLVLNKPDPTPPGDLAWETQATQQLQVDLGEAGSAASFGMEDPSATALEPMATFSTSTIPETVPLPDFVDESDQESIVEPPHAPAWNAEVSPSDSPGAPKRPDWRAEADWSSVTSPLTPPNEMLTENAQDNTPTIPESAYAPGANSPVPERGGGDVATEDKWGPLFPKSDGSEKESTMSEMAVATDATPPVPAESPDESPVGALNVVDSALKSAEAKMGEEQWYDALLTLSLVHGSPDISQEDNRRLLDLLDPLAGKVIYSEEHLIDGPHKVVRGDTITDIADRYQVPWQLLANVNSIKTPDFLEPGMELKVIRGPFRAEIDVQRNELTVFAGRLYAGRFPVTIGNDPAPLPGDYRVFGKQPGRTYYAGDGRTIPAEDTSNPYGKVWIDLGGDLCIHGSTETASPGQGCISLSPLDANDLYGILSKGSPVTILR